MSIGIPLQNAVDSVAMAGGVKTQKATILGIVKMMPPRLNAAIAAGADCLVLIAAVAPATKAITAIRQVSKTVKIAGGGVTFLCRRITALGANGEGNHHRRPVDQATGVEQRWDYAVQGGYE